MNNINPAKFHKMYGPRKPRISYMKKDFVDYVIMTMISVIVVLSIYGVSHPMSVMASSIGVYMIFAFLFRHGAKLKWPAILRRPQDAIYMIVYKFQNVMLIYLLAIAVLLAENFVIHLTPEWPHKTELMKSIAFALFYLHFAGFLVYRTVILFFHLRDRAHVREVLMQTTWKSTVNKHNYISIEILHAYFTGVITHITWLSPWFLVISFANFSLLLMPLVIFINLYVQSRFLIVFNAWFYRDHWLGHNSELEFVYLHGTHHDAIPCALIGVAGNGHLEGIFRQSIGIPTVFYNPILAFLLYSFEVQRDILLHQYVPGVYPKVPRYNWESMQHSTHHYRSLEPYGIGVGVDQPGVPDELKMLFKSFPDEFKNSINLDQSLTDFQWDNSEHRKFLDLFDKYNERQSEK